MVQLRELPRSTERAKALVDEGALRSPDDCLGRREGQTRMANTEKFPCSAKWGAQEAKGERLQVMSSIRNFFKKHIACKTN